MRIQNYFFRSVRSIFPLFPCDNFYSLSKFCFLSNNQRPRAAYLLPFIIFEMIVVYIPLIHSLLNCFFNLTNVFSLEHSSLHITSLIGFAKEIPSYYLARSQGFDLQNPISKLREILQKKTSCILKRK